VERWEERLGEQLKGKHLAYLASELGMPTGAEVQVRHITVNGVELEFVGILVPVEGWVSARRLQRWREGGEKSEPLDAPPWPSLREAEGGADQPALQIWRARARRPDSDIYAELQWRPGSLDGAGRLSLHGFEYVPGDERAQTEALHTGFAALRALRRIQRHTGRPPEVERHYAECVKTFKRLKAAAKSTRDYSTAAVGRASRPVIPSQTMKDRVRRFKEHGLPWPPPDD
jgi:hypothetical protein